MSAVVAWRYQGKEGWGNIWRVTNILPTFETPANWTVEALGVVGAVEPSPNGGVVRHDIEADGMFTASERLRTDPDAAP